MIDYVAQLIALRLGHPVLCSPTFMHGSTEPAPGIADIAWFGEDGGTIPVDAWNDPELRTLVLRRAATDADGRVAILTLLLNPTGQARHFRLPPPQLAHRILLDSALPDAPKRAMNDAEMTLAPHSAVLLYAEHQEERG